MGICYSPLIGRTQNPYQRSRLQMTIVESLVAVAMDRYERLYSSVTVRQQLHPGSNTQIRVWNAKSDVRQLLYVLKQHRGPITSLQVSPDDENLISSSTDGTCIIWDARYCLDETNRINNFYPKLVLFFRNFRRKLALQANTMHMATCFVPTGVQVLTCGTDRKIAYWETLDGSLVREVEGSTTGTINTVAVDNSGRYFLTGSDDCIVKLWEYRTATVVGLGLAHAAPISSCAFSPNGEFMVTVSTDGGTMIWKRPIETQNAF